MKSSVNRINFMQTITSQNETSTHPVGDDSRVDAGRLEGRRDLQQAVTRSFMGWTV